MTADSNVPQAREVPTLPRPSLLLLSLLLLVYSLFGIAVYVITENHEPLDESEFWIITVFLFVVIILLTLFWSFITWGISKLARVATSFRLHLKYVCLIGIAWMMVDKGLEIAQFAIAPLGLPLILWSTLHLMAFFFAMVAQFAWATTMQLRQAVLISLSAVALVAGIWYTITFVQKRVHQSAPQMNLDLLSSQFLLVSPRSQQELREAARSLRVLVDEETPRSTE